MQVTAAKLAPERCTGRNYDFNKPGRGLNLTLGSGQSAPRSNQNLPDQARERPRVIGEGSWELSTWSQGLQIRPGTSEARSGPPGRSLGDPGPC
jgi:hypothetical protein